MEFPDTASRGPRDRRRDWAAPDRRTPADSSGPCLESGRTIALLRGISRMSTDTVSTPVRLVTVAAFAFASALGAAKLDAQDMASHNSNGFEIRPYAGAYIPTGKQRDLLKDAVMVGGQASYRILPQLALTGTLGWSPSKDRVTPGDQTVDLWQYDLGAELRAQSWLTSGAWDFTPFIG